MLHAAFARSRSLTLPRKASLAAAADLSPRQVEGATRDAASCHALLRAHCQLTGAPPATLHCRRKTVLLGALLTRALFLFRID
jgi:hypothetical protein